MNNRCEEHLANIPRIAGSILLQFLLHKAGIIQTILQRQGSKEKVCAGGKSLRIEPHPFLYVEYVVRSFQ
jgi:hypothetical protein